MTDATGNVLKVPTNAGPGTQSTDDEILASTENLTQKGVTLVQTDVDAGLVEPEIASIVTDVEAGTLDGTYYYKLTALDEEGRETAVSPVEQIATVDAWALEGPDDLDFTYDTGSHPPADYFYVVTCTDALGETTVGNEVDASFASTEIMAPTLDSPITTAHNGGTLDDDEYFYVVSANNAVGETEASNEVSVTVSGEPTLGTPVQDAASGSETGGTLSADTYYYLVTACDGASGVGNETVASNETNATITGSTGSITLNWADITDAVSYLIYRSLDSGTNYQYLYWSATSGFVDDASHTPSAGTPPVSNETGTTNTGTATLEWAAISGATSYNVYRGTATTVWELIEADVPGLTYLDDGSQTPTTGEPPATNETETASRGFTLTWTQVPSATGYKVYRGSVTGTYTDKLIATIANPATVTLVDNDLATGSGSPPGTSTADSTAAEQTVVLTWLSVDDAEGYNVYRGESASVLYRIAEDVGTLSYTDNGDPDGTVAPPVRDATGISGVWDAGAVVCLSDTAGKYTALGLTDDLGPALGILRKQTDVSVEDKEANVVFAGRVKGTKISYVDAPAPLTLTQLQDLATVFAGRYDVVHDMLIF